MQIIQNKKYKLLVDIGPENAGNVVEVCGTVDNDVLVTRGKGASAFPIPLTTFIHCVEPVEEEKPTHRLEVKRESENTFVAQVVEEPKEEWPKVGVDMANGIDRAVFWLSFDNSQFVFKSHDILLEALEKMKDIARELSGK